MRIRAYLVTRNIDRHDFLASEVPLQIRDDERSDETTTGGINVDGSINVSLNEEIVDSLDVLVLTSVGGTQNDADTNGVLVTQRDRLLWVNDVPLRSAVHESLVHLEVAAGLFPADLDGRGHDQVGLVCGLALGLAALLPAPLHGQDGEHDGLGGTNRRGADAAGGSVEEITNHVDTSVLDLSTLGVLFIINEVLGEGISHELLSFLFL